MMQQTVKINGYKLVIDLMNMDYLKRLVDAQAILNTTIEANAEKFLASADDPRALYNRFKADVKAVCAFFDYVYGAGTADRIFKDCNDVAICMQAQQDFSAGIEKAGQAIRRKYMI